MSKSLLKRLLMLALAFVLAIPAQVFATEAEVSILEDTLYSEVTEILSGLEIMTFDAGEYSKTISRARFADLIVQMMGWSSPEDIPQDAADKYLGYTNNPDFDKNGDWIWQDEDTVAEYDRMENATPFYDVLTTHEYWNSIKMVAQAGLMVGSGRYFRPDAPITYAEAQKVLLCLCGASEMIQTYPGDVISQAVKLGISKNLKNNRTDGAVTGRDAAVMIYNAFHANVYGIASLSPEGAIYQYSKEETLLGSSRRIYRVKGIVTQTRISSLKSHVGGGDKYVFINNVRFELTGVVADSYLGEMVEAYYFADRNDENKILYMRKSSQNQELIVDAEDIINYENTYLNYYDKNEKEKKLYIGAATNIIYNGKALTNYTDSMIVPAQGYIRFLDANSDGTYETVFIHNIETVIVSGVDVNNEVIYNKLDLSSPVTLTDGEYLIQDKTGANVSLESIGVNSILHVERTGINQGEKLIYVWYSNKIVSGEILEVDYEERLITIADGTYKYSRDFDTTQLKFGVVVEFYLDINDKIVWSSKKAELTYGYLMGLHVEPFKEEASLKLYDVKNDEIVILNLQKKIKFNDSRIDAVDIVNKALIYDSVNQVAVRQLIKYKLNENNEVMQILTAGIDPDEFVEMDTTAINGRSLVYRSAINALIDTTPVVYLDSNSVFINVPRTDYTNEEGYYKTNLTHDNRYTVTRIYKNKTESGFAAVLIKEEDTSASQQAVRVGRPICMVSDIRQAISVDGEPCYRISGINPPSSTFKYDVVNSDLFSVASTIRPGDLIRYEVGGKNKDIIRLEKVFDEQTRTMVGGSNPLTSDSTSFISELNLVHGQVYSKSDEGRLMTIAPYSYTVTDGVVSKNGLDTTPARCYTLRTNSYTYYVFKSNGKVETANGLTDTVDVEGCGTGTDVVVYSQWSDPKTIYIYK